jgi:hypothetical protein
MWQGENVVSPETHKELNESASWTEVVRRGKTRSKSEKLILMIGGFWNIRGLNKTGRFKCLYEFIRHNKLDYVGIQETKNLSSMGGALP